MRKKLAPLALLLALSALAGCREGSVLERDNVSVEVETVSEPPRYEGNFSDSKPSRNPISQAECEQIVALLKVWGDLDYNIHPDQTNTDRGDYFPGCVNTERFIEEEITPRGSTRTYTERFYLIESGDFATEAGYTSKLDEMFTEGFKARYIQSSAWQVFRFKDGEVYVAGFNHYGFNPPEVLELEIEENGTAITITARNPENGETCSAALELTYSGFKIADADGGAVSNLSWLFSGDAAVDVYFGGEFAFRV